LPLQRKKSLAQHWQKVLAKGLKYLVKRIERYWLSFGDVHTTIGTLIICSFYKPNSSQWKVLRSTWQYLSKKMCALHKDSIWTKGWLTVSFHLLHFRSRHDSGLTSYTLSHSRPLTNLCWNSKFQTLVAQSLQNLWAQSLQTVGAWRDH
jgi:hypothetical protein